MLRIIGIALYLKIRTYRKKWLVVIRQLYRLQVTFPSETWLSPDLPEARTENFPEIPIGFRRPEKRPERPELLSFA
jgi:hypothetical protein